MIEISFKNQQHAQELYNRLTKWGNSLKYIHVYLTDCSTLTITGEKGLKTYTSLVFIPVFIQFIIDFFEGPTIVDILKKEYRYQDEDECCLIYNMFSQLVDDTPVSQQGKLSQGRKQYLLYLLENFLVLPIGFSFESFVQFRLKEYREFLGHMVGKAIEEYKLEQNMQVHVKNVRDYIQKRTYLNRVHLVIKEEIKVYDEHYNEIDLQALPIDHQFMKKCQEVIDDKVIAPLLSLSPKQLLVYASSKEEHFVLGLYNLFQERIKWYPVSAFVLEQKKSLQIHD